MKKRIFIILTLIFAVLMLASCGKKDKDRAEIPAEEPVPEIISTPAPSSTPKISQNYNSIDETGKDQKSAVKNELMEAAEGCRDIYEQADKGECLNVVLSKDVVYAMVERIAQMGYPAVDYLGELDMQYPDPIVEFGSTIATGHDTGVSYFTVYEDGQISVYHIGRENGMWYLIAMSAAWDRDCKPKVISEGRYVIGDVQFTEKGWLIYNRDTESFDDNQRSNTNSYVFVRVLPYDSTKRSLCERYIKPVGYFENNLFTTTWDSGNMGPIDFNSLYSQLFGMYVGTDPLSSGNAAEYFSTVEGTRLFIIPTETFENTVTSYFNIDTSVLKSISDYSYRLGGYFFFGYQDGIYNVTPRIPEPEVVDYWYNSDGSLTMRVDAVNKWYGTDKAFSHDVTVMEDDAGGFKYISNTLYADENSIIPGCSLSSMLDMERAKTAY
ncbi:MAG: DUF6070 family protein [Candidatus Limivicinus sp.]|jgi:hypothetical protein